MQNIRLLHKNIPTSINPKNEENLSNLKYNKIRRKLKNTFSNRQKRVKATKIAGDGFNSIFIACNFMCYWTVKNVYLIFIILN